MIAILCDLCKFFRRILGKIADIWDYNIDPRPCDRCKLLLHVSFAEGCPNWDRCYEFYKIFSKKLSKFDVFVNC
jgi:hypothetical protein